MGKVWQMVWMITKQTRTEGERGQTQLIAPFYLAACLSGYLLFFPSISHPRG